LGNEISVGVIGLGKMGLLHASTLSVMDGVKVTALCEKSSLISRFARKILTEASVVEGVAQLAGKGLDVVFVTTPIPTHFPIVREIYSRQIACNVFAEKTLASNCRESNELCSLAERASGITMVGYQRRFAVTFGKARELLKDGALGDVTSFEAHAYSSDFAEGPGEGKANTRGGVLRDLGSHAIDLALWFFGDLKAGPSRDPQPSSSNGVAPVVFGAKTKGGLEGEFKVSWSLPGYRMPEIGISVEGDRGSLMANDDRVELTPKGSSPTRWYRQDLSDGVPFLLGGPEYYRQDDEMVRCLREGRSPDDSFSSASKTDRIIEDAERSSR
jgi:predicted dehydrogenase